MTSNCGGDSYPDVWIDVDAQPASSRSAVRLGRTLVASVARPATQSGRRHASSSACASPVPGPIPTPEAILPYRSALVVNEYDVVQVIEGVYSERTIQIAQWAIRDGRLLPEARKLAGAAFTLAVERYDAHPELEGERLHLRGPGVEAPALPRRRPAVAGVPPKNSGRTLHSRSKNLYRGDVEGVKDNLGESSATTVHSSSKDLLSRRRLALVTFDHEGFPKLVFTPLHVLYGFMLKVLWPRMQRDLPPSRATDLRKTL